MLCCTETLNSPTAPPPAWIAPHASNSAAGTVGRILLMSWASRKRRPDRRHRPPHRGYRWKPMGWWNCPAGWVTSCPAWPPPKPLKYAASPRSSPMTTPKPTSPPGWIYSWPISAAVCHRHLNPVDANSASMDEPGAGEPPVLSHGAVTLRWIDAPSATHRRLPGGARWCSVAGGGVLDLLHHVLRTLFVRAGGITGVGVPRAPS